MQYVPIFSFRTEPCLPDYDKVYRPFLFNELPTVGKEEAIREILSRDKEADKIEELYEQSKRRFNFEREKELYEKRNELDPGEVLERYALLTYLVSREARNFLFLGNNPFKGTIFSQLF